MYTENDTVSFNTDAGTPWAKQIESNSLTRISAYGGRPESFDPRDGSCLEVWISADYGNQKGLCIRMNRDLARQLNQRITELLAPNPQYLKDLGLEPEMETDDSKNPT